MSDISKSPPMTMDERIEAAAHKWAPLAWTAIGLGDTVAHAARREASLRDVKEIIVAAFPELSGDKPTHWLAPWEATDEMWEAQHYREPEDRWKNMRDAYLGKGDGG